MSPPRPIGDPLAGALPEPAPAPIAVTPSPESSDIAGATEAASFGLLQGLTGNLFGYVEGSADRIRPEAAAQFPATAELARIRHEERQATREAHPFAKGAGEFAGMLLSPLGKVGELSKLTKATSVAGRIGSEMLGQGAVGALYGAGQTLSDASLGDHEITADKLIAGSGLGALLGAGGGLLGAGIAEATKAVLPSLVKSLEGAQGGLEDFANDRWLKASGGVQAEIKAIPLPERPSVAQVLREHFTDPASALPKADVKEVLGSVATESDAVGQKLIQQAGISDAGGLLPSMDRDAAQRALEAGQEVHGKALGKLLEDADKAGARPAPSGFVQRFNDFLAGLNPAERDIITPDVEQAQKWLLELGSHPVGSPKAGFRALNDLKSTIQRNTNWTTDGAVRYGLKRQIAGIIRDEIDKQLEGQIGPALAADFQRSKASFGALAKAEDALGRKASTGADAIAAIADGAGLQTPELARFSALQHAQRLLKRGVDRELGNRWVSLSDYMTGLAAGVARGDLAGVALGIGSALGHKVLRERGSALAAQLADRIAASPALSTIATSFAQKIPQIVPQLGPYGAALSLAASESPRRALAEHMVMAQTDPAYRQAAQVAGLVPEDSQQHGAAMVRAHGLAQVAGAVLEHDKLLDRAVDSAIKGGKAAPSSTAAHDTQDFGTKRMRRDAIGSHDKRVDEVRQLAANPDALVERLGANLGNLHNVAPGLAAVLTQRANSAVQFLSNEARTPPKAGPLAPAWSATEHERWVFARKLQAVEDPMSVLRHASAGTMTGADVAAFRAVYPALHAELTRRIVERVTQKPESVSYGQRVMLSLFTGLDLDGTMNPAAVQANQQAIARQSVKPSNQAPRPTGNGGGELTLAQRTATPSQRHEMQEGV